MAVVLLVRYFMICKTFSVENYVHDLDLDLWNGLKSAINMLMEKPYATFYLLAIAMFA